jgi:hypothetical protein
MGMPAGEMSSEKTWEDLQNAVESVSETESIPDETCSVPTE